MFLIALLIICSIFFGIAISLAPNATPVVDLADRNAKVHGSSTVINVGLLILGSDRGGPSIKRRMTPAEPIESQTCSTQPHPWNGCCFPY